MPRKLKTDDLKVSCYARHGDMCGLDGAHDVLGCASRHKADDYVLVARFAYLQEAGDYCREGARRGVNMHLVSRIVPTQPFHENFPVALSAPAAFVNGVCRVCGKPCGDGFTCCGSECLRQEEAQATQ